MVEILVAPTLESRKSRARAVVLTRAPEDRMSFDPKKTGRIEGGEAYTMNALATFRNCTAACSGIYLIVEVEARF